MLILVREKKTTSSIRYILQEPKSGLEKEWTPPKDLPAGKVYDSLVFVASMLEKNATQYLAEAGIQAPNSDLKNLPPLEEITLQQYGEYFMTPTAALLERT